MSGIVLLFHRDGSPVDVPVLGGMLATIAHRGPDGRRVELCDPLGIGHCHFWTTPEEVGERQPVRSPTGRFLAALDGRLDNRDELLRALAPDARGAGFPSDAALVCLSLERWEENCFERFVGPFAVAAYDEHLRRVLCARDPLGDRSLFYHLTSGLLLVASEPQAVLTHPAVGDAIDEETMVRYFAVRAPAAGRTFFAEVSELLPGHVLLVDPEREQQRQFHEFARQPAMERRSDDDCAAEFRSLLAESVRCRMRARTPVAVMMSGGLDSTAVAAMVARELAGHGVRHRLRAISYVFDELKSCDERRFMAPVISRFGLDAVQFAGDDAWPLRNTETWPRNPNAPVEGPYRRLKERVYRTAREGGTPVILTGDFGDQLFAGAERWLLDLLVEGRNLCAALEVGKVFLRRGLAAALTDPGLRQAAARLPGIVPATRLIRTAEPGPTPEWLTPAARAQLAPEDTWPLSAQHARRSRQHRAILGMMAAYNASAETFYAGRESVELRYPFRDRRLVEFALRVPAHQLVRGGADKYVLRRAMRGILPEVVRTRETPTPLTPLYARGLVEKEWETVAALLWNPSALWRRYVRAAWLQSVFPSAVRALRDSVETVVPWHCLCAELWKSGREGQPGSR